MDAGYRWAYYRLNAPGIVTRGKLVSVPAVLAASDYWNAPERDYPRLCHEILPKIRSYLEEHAAHGIMYVELEDIMALAAAASTTWRKV